MSSNELHVHTPDGNTLGPYTLEEVKSRARDGKLPAGSQVHLDGEWRSVDSLLGAQGAQHKQGLERRKLWIVSGAIVIATGALLLLIVLVGLYFYFTRLTAETICNQLKEAEVAATCEGGKPGTLDPTKGVKSWHWFKIAGAEQFRGTVLVFESKEDLASAQEFFRGVNEAEMPFQVSNEWCGLMPISCASKDPPFLIQMPAAGARHLSKIRALFEDDGGTDR